MMNPKSFCARGANLPESKTLGTMNLEDFLAEYEDDLGSRYLTLWLLLFFFTLAYGAAHMAALTLEFPTEIEYELWLVSACFLIASFCVWFMFSTRSPWLANLARWLVILCFAASRLYIVVEAFISLRAVPIGVYRTPAWIEMMFHF